MKIVITGAAGLVGQNLIPRLKRRAASRSSASTSTRRTRAILRACIPTSRSSRPISPTDDGWQDGVAAREVVVVGHAQIGGLDEERIQPEQRHGDASGCSTAVSRSAAAAYIVHISSSVVELGGGRLVHGEQEGAGAARRCDAGHPHVVLRPTLMFGWFDRKHLGLARPLHAAGAGLSRAGQRPLPAPAALRRRFLRHHRVLHRTPDERCPVQHLRTGADRLHRSDPRWCGTRPAHARPSCGSPIRLFWLRC